MYVKGQNLVMYAKVLKGHLQEFLEPLKTHFPLLLKQTLLVHGQRGLSSYPLSLCPTCDLKRNISLAF